MPLLKSAIKKLRKDKKREKANDEIRKMLKDTVKKIVKGKGKVKIDEAFSLIDKAAKKNLIHKNKAARLKSRISNTSKTIAPPAKKAGKNKAKSVKQAKISKKK